MFVDAVFGAHLRLLCEREKGKIPKFVQKCVVAIEKKGLCIYCINQLEVEQLCRCVNVWVYQNNEKNCNRPEMMWY